jgi:hypothetical protein
MVIIMVEFPSYIKVLPGNAVRRANSSSSQGTGTSKASRLNEYVPTNSARVVNLSLIARENQAATASQVPTPAEATAALRSLQEHLPDLGQAVGDLHSNLDRRRILDLLAPLMDV